MSETCRTHATSIYRASRLWRHSCRENMKYNECLDSYRYHEASFRWFLQCWWPELVPLSLKVKSAVRLIQVNCSSITFSIWTAAAGYFSANRHHSSLRPGSVVVEIKPEQGTWDWSPPWWLLRYWHGPVLSIHQRAFRVYKTRLSSSTVGILILSAVRL